jgi:hypothetical protein
MRIYIIGNDGITPCREPPAAVSEGEIVVASNEELHAAPLSGKRLLALWNALPDIEKRRTRTLDPLVTHQCTTTCVSAGDAGARNFAAFRRFIVAQTRTRLCAFVHIANTGLVSFPIAELTNNQHRGCGRGSQSHRRKRRHRDRREGAHVGERDCQQPSSQA